MTVDWTKVRHFIHRRTFFCTAAVLEPAGIRLYPIGSLRLDRKGEGTYLEIFAQPIRPGCAISFLAVEINPWAWFKAMLTGRFEHPPALRLRGSAGLRRPSTAAEKEHFLRRVGWLGKTRGGRALWSHPDYVRQVSFQEARPVRLGKMTHRVREWFSLPWRTRPKTKKALPWESLLPDRER